MNSALPPLQPIPELDASQRLGALPERLQAALDAREAEKAMLEQLVEQWLQALRPELERLAREVVERSAREYWQVQKPGAGPN